MKLLEVRGLKCAVDGREILHGVDLTVNKGETVVILGANGAGKSTVVRAVMGLLDQADLGGEVKFDRETIFSSKLKLKKKIDERARRGMFLSYQEPVEVPGVSLKEMLWTALEERAKGGSVRQEVEEKIAEAVKLTGVEAFTPGREVNVGASGGERKKNEILQMMVLEPKLAMLDEIDSGLDVDAAAEMSRVLAEWQKKTGVAYVVITHNMRILENLRIDKVYVMQEGRIVRAGGAEIITEVEQKGFKQ